MAAITASDLLKRVNNSNKVHEVLEKLMNSMIDAADAGKTSFTTNVTDSSLTNAVVRQLKKRGFKVTTHYGATQLEISWAKEVYNTADDGQKKTEAHHCNECCTSVNGKPADQIKDPKPAPRKQLPTPPSSTTPATNQTGVTVFKNGKPVTTQQQTKQANNQSQKKRGKKRHYNNNRGNMFNRCVVIERCTFNVTVTVDDINVSK